MSDKFPGNNKSILESPYLNKFIEIVLQEFRRHKNYSGICSKGTSCHIQDAPKLLFLLR